MNATERKYAARLERLKREKKIEFYGFETTPLQLSEKRTYLPDFTVDPSSAARVEFHEVKAMWTERKVGWKGDGQIKFEWAVSRFPHVFVLAALHRDGSWHLEEYNGESATITPEERAAGRSGVHALVQRHGKRERRTRSGTTPCSCKTKSRRGSSQKGNG